MGLEYTFLVDNSDGETAFFTDTSTDWDYSLVAMVRLYLGNFTDDQNQTTLVEDDELEQYHEYVKTSLVASVYDNKIIQVGQRYIPFVTGLVVLPGDTFTKTGRYSQPVFPADYLPTENHNVLTRTPQDFGFGADTTIFPGYLYYCQYEVYGITSPNPVVTPVHGVTYIVYGASGTAIYNGSTYRLGEIFIGDTSGTVSFTGAATLKVMFDARFHYFPMIYQLEKDLQRLNFRIITECGCDEGLTYRVMVMRSKLESIDWSVVQNKTDATTCNQIILDVESEIRIINNSIGI